jgi:hypothetical protein
VNLEKFKNISYGILLGAGTVAFATGFFGFFFTCCKTKCYVITYGVFLSFTWLSILVLGAFVTSVAFGTNSGIQMFCDGTLGKSNISLMVAN